MSEIKKVTETVDVTSAEYPYVIEMCNITKEFPGIIASDNITLQLKRGEIHALLGENGAGKSTLMSVLFGLYQPEKGEIRKNGEAVTIKDPNDANDLGIGMVHQHFKLVDVFTVLDNIILGVEPNTVGFLRKKQARQKVMELSKTYGLNIDPDALVENITVGMQQRTEILKMLYRDNEILIFDEPTAVLTPQEIDELMDVIRGLAKDLHISRITAKRAYEELEKEGFIYTLPAKGCYVAPKNTELLREENLKKIEWYIDEIAKLAASCSLSREDIMEMVKFCMEEER